MSESVQSGAGPSAETIRKMFVKTVSIRIPSGLAVDDVTEVESLFAPAEWADEALLDFSELPSISATVLGAMLSLLNRMVAHNRIGVVRITGANPRILRVFALCRADSLFDVSDSRSKPFENTSRIYTN